MSTSTATIHFDSLSHSIFSQLVLFFTLSICQRFFNLNLMPHLVHNYSVHLCRRKKFFFPNICHENVTRRQFQSLYLCCGLILLVSSTLLLLFCPLYLTFEQRSIYFLIYACVTIQRFGAASLAVSSWIIGLYPLGLFCVMSVMKTCWYCFWKGYNDFLNDSLWLSFTVLTYGLLSQAHILLISLLQSTKVSFNVCVSYL